MNVVSLAIVAAALTASFTPALADSAEGNLPRVIVMPSVVAAPSPVIEGRQTAPIVSSGITPAQQWVIDRNRSRDHR